MWPTNKIIFKYCENSQQVCKFKVQEIDFHKSYILERIIILLFIYSYSVS